MAATKKRQGAKELRTMSSVELKEQVEGLRQELWQQRLKAREGSLKQTHQLAAARRQIARIHTVLHEPPRAAAAAAKGS